MLFNPQWNKADQISMKDFIAWLETKDPNETFNYYDTCGHCCIGQYMAARGIEWTEKWQIPYRDTCNKIFGSWFLPITYYVLAGKCNSSSGKVLLRKFGDVLDRIKVYKKHAV